MLQATQPSRDPEDGNSSRHGDDSFIEDNTGQIKIIHKDQVKFIHSKNICEGKMYSSWIFLTLNVNKALKL